MSHPLTHSYHYNKVAKIFREVREEASRNKKIDKGTINVVLLDFVEWFSADNPNFDSQKFLEACGLPTHL